MKSKLNARYIPYLFLFPTLLCFAVFYGAPILNVIRTSFFRDDMVKIEFVGLKHYADVLHDKMFWRAVVNSLLYACCNFFFILIPALTVALNINTLPYKSQGAIRTLFYIPAVVSPIIMGGAWRWIYNYRGGLLNYLLSLVDIKPIYWLGSRMTGIPAMSLIIMTFGLGNVIIVFSAVLNSIDTQLYEVAKIDGASPRQIRWRIMMPIILPWILFVVLLQTIAAFLIWELIWGFTSGGPAGYTASVLYNIFDTGFIRSAYGVASAKTIVLALIMVVIAAIKSRAERLKV